jgi:hypothetical protein
VTILDSNEQFHFYKLWISQTPPPPNPNIKKPKWFPSQTTFIFDPNFSLFALSSQDFLNTKKHNTKTMDKGWIKRWDPRSLCEYFYYCWICFRNVLILQILLQCIEMWKLSFTTCVLCQFYYDQYLSYIQIWVCFWNLVVTSNGHDYIYTHTHEFLFQSM